MTIYIIIALCLCLFAFLLELKFFQSKKIYKISFLVLSSFMLFFTSGFRLNTGHDFAAYAKTAINMVTKSLTDISFDRMEKGYLILNRYAQLINSDFKWVFIVTSFLVILLVSIIAYKYCKNPVMGLTVFYFLGFYFNSMNFIRNMIAAAIVLYAYQYVKEKQFLRYLVIVLLASTFHFSAIFMIPFYFIIKLKFNYITLSGYVIFGGILFAFSIPIVKFVSTYVYTSYDPMTSIHMFGGIEYQYVVFIAIILISVLFIIKDIEKKSKWGTILIHTVFLDFYFGLLGVKHSILSRFAAYFGPMMALVLIPFIIDLLIKLIKNQSKKSLIYKIKNYVCLFAICGACISFFVFALLNNYNGVIPHDWIWNFNI